MRRVAISQESSPRGKSIETRWRRLGDFSGLGAVGVADVGHHRDLLSWPNGMQPAIWAARGEVFTQG